MQNSPKPIRSVGFEADFAYGPPDAFYAAGKMPQAGRLYVDRFGREREDTFVMDGSERELVSIDIWDVVAGKFYALIPTEKKILLEDPIDREKGREDLAIYLPGTEVFVMPRHSLYGRRIIGTKAIEGLTCKGSVRERRAGGLRVAGREIPDFVIECWRAEKIAYIVAVNATWTFANGKNIATTFRLSNIQIGGPDPELFKVPDDYQTVKLVPLKD